jgi:hypothetical protein
MALIFTEAFATSSNEKSFRLSVYLKFQSSESKGGLYFLPLKCRRLASLKLGNSSERNFGEEGSSSRTLSDLGFIFPKLTHMCFGSPSLAAGIVGEETDVDASTLLFKNTTFVARQESR